LTYKENGYKTGIAIFRIKHATIYRIWTQSSKASPCKSHIQKSTSHLKPKTDTYLLAI